MTEAEFEFDAPNVCENLLLNQQDENTLNCTEAVDWFLKLHDHEAKVKEGASFSQQQSTVRLAMHVLSSSPT